jgi:site-specific DNA-methyltransferase (adenine-specific)
MPHEMKLAGGEGEISGALHALNQMSSDSVDLVITDPPYDTLEKWREMGTTTRLKESTSSSNAWFPTVPPAYLKDCFRQCYRVLKNNSHLYVMCDEETGDNMKPVLREIGFNLRKSIIWHKVGKLKEFHCPSCGTFVCAHHTPGTPGMGYPYRSQWEMILLAEKGKRKPPEDKSVRNVLQVPWIKNKTAYPTEKPVELLETLIKQSSFEGDLVLDPFAGSGSCGEAAFKQGRNFLGFDVEQKALDYFEARKANWVFADPADAPPLATANNILAFFRD